MTTIEDVCDAMTGVHDPITLKWLDARARSIDPGVFIMPTIEQRSILSWYDRVNEGNAKALTIR